MVADTSDIQVSRQIELATGEVRLFLLQAAALVDMQCGDRMGNVWQWDVKKGTADADCPTPELAKCG